MKTATVIELRKYRRQISRDLFALFDDEIVRVVNISIAGICIERPAGAFPSRNIEFLVVPRAGNDLDIVRAIPVQGHIVGETGDHLRIVFASVNHALSNIIGCYAEGDEPSPEAVSG
ncbi:hypothetical protein [Telmatospirillum sp.]|uniref:hypothetical protein n=1 Tax=Telmatospirillum sp. TaxID=2079197 RepID=UPI002843D76C|nr:hypothetical protein [Telmatospirillum sp.]MDR3439053.1 hypothetical protein [Telmatospirillum sp.]